jgi:hypothetical protein
MPPGSVQTDHVEFEESLFAAADSLIHGTEALAIFFSDQIINVRPNQGFAGWSTNHGQSRRVHEKQGSVTGHDLDAFRGGLDDSAELLVGLDLGFFAVRDVHQQVDATDNSPFGIPHHGRTRRKPKAGAVRPFRHTFNAIGNFDALQGNSHWTLVMRQGGAVRKEDLPCYAPLISADLWRPPRKLHRRLIEIRQPTLGVSRVNSDRQGLNHCAENAVLELAASDKCGELSGAGGRHGVPLAFFERTS